MNGEIFTIIPDKLLLFKTPSPLVPDGQDWVVVDGIRNFSPAFYVDLFDYLDVGLVVQLDGASYYDAETFEGRGAAVCGLEDLGYGEGRGRFSLQTVGRFVDVVREAGGAVAVHCDDHLAATLLAAHLLRAGLFADPDEAVAWIAVARGAAGAPDYGLLAPAPSAAGRERLRRGAQSLADLSCTRGE